MTDTYVRYVDSEPDFVISIGDGASPETFTPKCSMNKNRALNKTATVAAQLVTNCTNPGAPGYMARKVTATDWDAAGDGTLNVLDAVFFDTWFLSGLPKNIKVNVGSITGALVHTGPAILETFNITGGPNGDHVQAAVKFSAAGPSTSTTHS